MKCEMQKNIFSWHQMSFTAAKYEHSGKIVVIMIASVNGKIKNEHMLFVAANIDN